eukprot:scaffold365140_cov55-Prasinocladus_malaysianus.AAC.1
MTVRPPSASPCRVVTRERAVVESRPEVGSSRKMMEGLMSISWPTLTRLRSPPETPRIMNPPMM